MNTCLMRNASGAAPCTQIMRVLFGDQQVHQLFIQYHHNTKVDKASCIAFHVYFPNLFNPTHLHECMHTGISSV